MVAQLLSLFTAIFTGNCEPLPHVSAINLAKCADVQSGNRIARSSEVLVAQNKAEERDAENRKDSELAFEEDDAFLAEVYFTPGEKYEGSFSKLLWVQASEQIIELPKFEHSSSVRLPNQPTLVVLKVILQV